MPSNSLLKWNTDRSVALDEIEHAHAKVGGSERGRRYATQQINFAYVALLSSQFQGFCRDLHSECVEQIVSKVPVGLQEIIGSEFIWNRSLGKGNPQPSALGSDFGRLGIDFWPAVYSSDARNERRRFLLEQVLAWRNAIAHQDFDTVAPTRNPVLHLARVRAWRRTLGALAYEFDRTMYNYLVGLLGSAPW